MTLGRWNQVSSVVTRRKDRISGSTSTDVRVLWQRARTGARRRSIPARRARVSIRLCRFGRSDCAFNKE